MYSNDNIKQSFEEYLNIYSIEEIQALIQEIHTRDTYIKKHINTSHDIGREKKKYNKGLDLIENDIFLDAEQRRALSVLRKAVAGETATSVDIKRMVKEKIIKYVGEREYTNLVKDIELYVSYYL